MRKPRWLFVNFSPAVFVGKECLKINSRNMNCTLARISHASLHFTTIVNGTVGQDGYGKLPATVKPL